MNVERTKTSVTVKVIDTTSLESEAVKFLREAGKNVDKVEVIGKIGYIQTPKGIYVIDCEGIGSLNPITAENAYVMEFWETATKDNETMTCEPSCEHRMSDKEILTLPVTREENLADFIRVFGPRLERNYRDWKEAMEGVLV